jgi:hypothetical protein
MASPQAVFKKFAIPESSQLSGFLASCPALGDLDPAALEAFANEAELIRYDDGTRLFTDTSPDRRTPLRIVVHGKASWDSNRASDQKGAWMLSQGSLLGLEGLNEWAKYEQIEGCWERSESPRIRCQAIGPLWVLELPATRFAAFFGSAIGKPILARLLERVGTAIHSPDVVSAMRRNDQFSRTAPVFLYKLLEWAPTTKILPIIWDPNQGDQPDLIVGPTAVYYVIEGELKMQVDQEEKTIGVGQLDGANLFVSPEEASSVSLPTPVGDTSAVMVTKDMLWTAIRQLPGFARSLGPRREATP